MGWLSKIAGVATGGIVGDDPFKFLRTGATAANRQAKTLAEQQADEQRTLTTELKGMYDPYIQQGTEASNLLQGFYQDGGADFYQQAQQSPAYSAMMDASQQAVGRMPGTYRSGFGNRMASEASQGALQNLVNQRLRGLGDMAATGFDATGNYVNVAQGGLTNVGSTRTAIANADLSRAANKQQILGGLVQAGAKIGTSMLSPTAGLPK
tara:strand:+ start:22022 stop:22648 length:627 start_codon:yes stop_codon:yes gene_type:complete